MKEQKHILWEKLYCCCRIPWKWILINNLNVGAPVAAGLKIMCGKDYNEPKATDFYWIRVVRIYSCGRDHPFPVYKRGERR